MSATADDVAATTATPSPVADANETEPKQGAESAPAVSNTDEDTSKVLDPVQKRIDELTRRRYDAERQAEYWRQQAMSPRQPEPPPVQEPPAAGKRLADFGYDEEKYQDYLFEQAEKRATKAAEAVLSKKQTEEARIRNAVSHRNREAEFAKKVPDYFEVAHYAPISESVAEMVMESDISADLAYHLGKNPDIATRLSQLPERAQARELGRIEAKLLAKPTPPVISNAPPPAPKLEGRTNASPIEPGTAEADKLSTDEWLKRRNKQLSRK